MGGLVFAVVNRHSGALGFFGVMYPLAQFGLPNGTRISFFAFLAYSPPPHE